MDYYYYLNKKYILQHKTNYQLAIKNLLCICVLLKTLYLYTNIEKETALSNLNSRTSEIDDYKKFIINKKKLKNNVRIFYNNILFRQLNFGYIKFFNILGSFCR